jgi:hypothetical protein
MNELNPQGFKTVQEGGFIEGPPFGSERTETEEQYLIRKRVDMTTSHFTEHDRKPYAELDSTIINSKMTSGRGSPLNTLDKSRITNYGFLPSLNVETI